MMPSQEADRLPDFLKPGLAVIICGTAAGRRSAAVGHYYANPVNRFWKTLHAVGLTPVRLTPEEDRTVLQYGIGLTDLVKAEAGMDHEITGLAQGAVLAARLAAIVHTYAPVRLAFNGKGAGAVNRALGVKDCDWGRQPALAAFPDTSFWLLPDTSGANGRFPRLRHHWTALAEDIHPSA